MNQQGESVTAPVHEGDVLAVLDFDPGGRSLGHRLVEPDTPHLHVSDLAATRGDGVFETISIGHGHPQALDAHLARFAKSARMLDLPAPDEAGRRAAIAAVAERFTNVAEAFVKIVLSRGIEGGTAPTGWAWADVSGDFTAARTEGIRAITLDRGYRSDIATTAPWLLAGAKTLSYAVNTAVKREAARRGADDIVFVSTDGMLLEGGNANLVLRINGELVTPRTDIGILAGTTQADLFRWAGERGIPSSYALLEVSALDRADAAWLVSSVRHAAPLRTIDSRPYDVDVATSREMNEFLRARTS